MTGNESILLFTRPTHILHCLRSSSGHSYDADSSASVRLFPPFRFSLRLSTYMLTNDRQQGWALITVVSDLTSSVTLITYVRARLTAFEDDA